jgi:type II secretory pathway component PulF
MSVRLKASEKLELISNLGAMLSAGIPLLETIDALLEGARGRMRIVLLALRKDLEAGQTIANSFSRFPDSFDPITINLIRGGEEAGNLEDILKDLRISDKPKIYVFNKVDLAPEIDTKKISNHYNDFSPVFVSAETKAGIDNLIPKVEQVINSLCLIV